MPKMLARFFKPEMSAAVGEGRKTETRRLITRPVLTDGYWRWPNYESPIIPRYANANSNLKDWSVERNLRRLMSKLPERFPEKPGDILWPREPYQVTSYIESEGLAFAAQVRFKSAIKGRMTLVRKTHLPPLERLIKLNSAAGWLTFTPRWAARWFAEILEVRAEPLEMILVRDVVSEGILPPKAYRDFIKTRFSRTPPRYEDICEFCGCTDYAACPGECYWVTEGRCSTCLSAVHPPDLPAIQSLSEGWNEINPHAPFHSKPWVKVIQFELIPARRWNALRAA